MIWFLTIELIIAIGIGAWLYDGSDGVHYLSWTAFWVFLTMMIFGITHSELPINETWMYVFAHWF